MDYEKWLDYVEARTHEDKKAGYANILHELLIMVRADQIEKRFLTALTDVIHEMPPFLAKDLKGFSDEMFWKRAQKYNDGVLRMLANWFEMGVVLNGFNEDMRDWMS